MPSAVEEALAAMDALDPELAWVIGVRRHAAREAEDAHGPLAGVPVIVKDVFADGGRRPTVGSHVPADWLTGTAPALGRLRALGAAVAGYANLQEWCLGTISAISALGPIRNPHDPDLIAGGSSGGSAACVAAGIVPVALGSDAGGSVRVPAACCGVVGFKPTFAAIPTEGSTCEGIPIDHVGLLARTVDDIALVFGALTGREPFEGDVERLRVGVARPHFFDALDSSIADALEAAIASMTALVADVREVEIRAAPRARHAVADIMLPLVAEQLRSALADRPGAFHPETRAMLERGASLPNTAKSGALAVAASVRAGWARVFREVDVVITPTLAQPPPRLDAGAEALRSVERSHLELNAPMNLGGVPAMSMPCGELGASLTFTGPVGADGIVLKVARAWEEVRGPLGG